MVVLLLSNRFNTTDKLAVSGIKTRSITDNSIFSWRIVYKIFASFTFIEIFENENTVYSFKF